MKIWDNRVKGFVEFTPSSTGEIVVMKADGSKSKHPANRAERRRLLREERRRQKHEKSSKKESHNIQRDITKGDGKTSEIKEGR